MAIIYDAKAVFDAKRDYDKAQKEAMSLKTFKTSIPVEKLYDAWTGAQNRKRTLANMVAECRENPLRDDDHLAMGMLG